MLQLKRFMKSQGFTLVELLIVIAVIGILAVAVLAALDPIEQLKKSRDTGRLADARELYSAYNRYYASYQCYPQEMNASGTACGSTSMAWASGRSTTDTGEQSGVSGLVANGELKPAFSGKPSLSKGQLWSFQASDDAMAICFTPESKSARAGGMGPVLTSGFAAGNCSGIGTWSDTNYIVPGCVLCVR